MTFVITVSNNHPAWIDPTYVLGNNVSVTQKAKQKGNKNSPQNVVSGFRITVIINIAYTVIS